MQGPAAHRRPLPLVLAGLIALGSLALGATEAHAQRYDPYDDEEYYEEDEDSFARECTLQERLATALADPGFVQLLLEPGFLTRELLSPAFLAELFEMRTIQQRERALDRAYRELDRGDRDRARRHFDRADRLDTARTIAGLAAVFRAGSPGGLLSRFGCY